jgi:ribosome assembly protein RRB1
VIYDKKITQKRNPTFFWRKLPSTLLKIMSKRAAEEQENGDVALKSGERPETASLDMEEVGEFEDEFEDEYESEDEILEAGVDGRPDAEREADERAGK